jgi:hypothetical protein
VAICAGGRPERISPGDAAIVAQAVETYRGEFLSTPLQINSVAFEEWLLLRQTHLHMQAVDALDFLVKYHELRDENKQAAEYARRQIELEPLRETGHR